MIGSTGVVVHKVDQASFEPAADILVGDVVASLYDSLADARYGELGGFDPEIVQIDSVTLLLCSLDYFEMALSAEGAFEGKGCTLAKTFIDFFREKFACLYCD